MDKKILIVSIAFPPDSDVGSLRPGSFAKYLPLYGWTPYTLTGPKFYITRIDPDLQREIGRYGRIYSTSSIPHPKKWYRFLKGRFLKNQTSEKSRPELISGKSEVQEKNIIKRLILTLQHIPDEYWGWIPFAVPKGMRIISKESIPIIFSSAPPWTCHLVGLFLKLATNCFWIADFRDLWSLQPKNNLKSIRSLSKRLDHFLENIVLCKADQIVCVTEEMADDFNKLYQDIFREKITVIPNGFEQEDYDKIPKGERKEHKFTITYTGNLYPFQNPLSFLKASKELISERKILSEELLIRFVGEYETAFTQIIKEMGLEGIVVITGYLQRQEALKYNKESDVLLIIQGDYKCSISVKYYEYLATGKPILALASDGATKNIVLRTRSGLVVEPDDIVKIKDAIMYLYEHWKNNRWSKPDQNVVQYYERKRLTGQFAELLNQSLDELNKIPE